MRDSSLMARTATAKTMSPAAMTTPTLSSRASLFGMAFPPAAQKMTQHRLAAAARLLDGADEVHPALVQEGDPVADEKGALDVVRHDDGRDVQPGLHAADQVVDGAGGHRIE